MATDPGDEDGRAAETSDDLRRSHEIERTLMAIEMGDFEVVDDLDD